MKTFNAAWYEIEEKAAALAIEATSQGTNCGYTFTGDTLSAEVYNSATGEILAVVSAA